MVNFKVSLSVFVKLNRFLQLTQKISNSLKLAAMIIVLSTIDVAAQYTDVINSNNPGFSQSPYSVGSGVYQVESSLFYKKGSIESTFSTPDFNGINLSFRSSFFLEKLEFIVNTAYQNDRVAFKNILTSSYYTKGLSEFVLGAKYLVFESVYTDKSKEVRSWVERHKFDWKRLIPSVAVYGGANFDFVNTIHQTGGISPRVGILLQNNIYRNLNFVTNFYYDKIATDYAEFLFILTATYSLNDRWSTFFENRSRITKFRNDTDLGSGITYLFNRNFQINSSLRFLLEGEAKGFYSSIGVSYRIDRHIDEFIELDANGNPIVPDDRYKGSKSLLSKMFGGITSIFKGKKKKGENSDITLIDDTLKNIEKNIDPNEDNLYNRNKAEGKPIRKRPVRVQVKPTKIKKQKRKKTKEEKRKEKEEQKKKKEKEKQEKKDKKEKTKKKKEEEKKKEDNN